MKLKAGEMRESALAQVAEDKKGHVAEAAEQKAEEVRQAAVVRDYHRAIQEERQGSVYLCSVWTRLQGVNTLNCVVVQANARRGEQS